MFDLEKDDVYTFTDRCYRVLELRGYRLVQLNLDLQLRGLAIDWYDIELLPNDKAILASAPDVSIWVNALIRRFKPDSALILQELEQSHYIRADAANKKDPIKFYYKILRLTRYDNKLEAERAMTVYVYFEL